MLVNALGVVKSCYFDMKFSRLIQINKPVKFDKCGKYKRDVFSRKVSNAQEKV